DRGLFDSLRKMRHEIAEERGVPAYVLFSDASLREMARIRPGSLTFLLKGHGVVDIKVAGIGIRVLQVIAEFCAANGLPLDSAEGRPPSRQRTRKQNDAKAAAFAMFAEG